MASSIFRIRYDQKSAERIPMKKLIRNGMFVMNDFFWKPCCGKSLIGLSRIGDESIDIAAKVLTFTNMADEMKHTADAT